MMEEENGKPKKKGFIFYHRWLDMFKTLNSKEDIICLLEAMVDYDREHKPQEFGSPVLNMAFSAIKPDLDDHFETYQNICKRNSRNRKNGWKNKKDSNNDT